MFKSHFNDIVQVVKDKASLKQQIYRNTHKSYIRFEELAKSIISDLKKEISQFDRDVSISFNERGEFQFQLKIGGDIVLFQMHTNVFDFDPNHSVMQTSYVKGDKSNSYCGIINIYNFLADSVKYNRYEDDAYLIGRVFINKDNHFFVEGKRKLNFIHNDFINEVITEDAIKDIIEHAILYSMDFDLFTPPYKHVQTLSVGQLIRESSAMQSKTGKRLGYKFSFED